MRHDPKNRVPAWRRRVAALLVASIASPQALADTSVYAEIPISTVPVGVGMASTVKPNFLVTIDDSGSMNWEFMPGEKEQVFPQLAHVYASGCNRIYFDPAQPYPLPPSPADPAVAMPEPVVAADGSLPLDGFNPTGARMKLTAFTIQSPQYPALQPPPRDAFWYEFKLGGTPQGVHCNIGTNWAAANDGLPAGTWEKKLYSAADAETKGRFNRWFVYYRTRLNVMKSAAGRAFATASEGLRIGLVTVNPWLPGDKDRKVIGSKYLKIADFGGTQRQAWLEKLYGLTAELDASTPLLEALSRAGRHFAGYNDRINAGMDEDPVEASCQRNYTLLATDGYWNEDRENQLKNTYALGIGRKFDGTHEIGQQDGDLPPGKALDGASPLAGTTIPRPFSDVTTLEQHRQKLSEINLSNEGEDTGLCPTDVKDADHPYYGYKVKIPDPIPGGSDKQPYIVWRLKDSKYYRHKTRPKGYDENFPMPSAGVTTIMDPEYNLWWSTPGDKLDGTGPVTISAADAAAIEADLARTDTFSAEVPKQSGSTWAPYSYSRKIQNQYAPDSAGKRLRFDSAGYPYVCSLRDYTCPGLADGSFSACNFGSAHAPDEHSSKLHSLRTAPTALAAIEKTDVQDASTSLSDVAMYYFANDLRTADRNPTNRQNSALEVSANNVPGSDSNWKNLEKDAAAHQHMTTYTLGMGVTGFLQYESGYKNQSEADKTNLNKDYARIKYGMQGWIPVWLDGQGRDRIDDLWHAAVNGRGTYLSASDPDQLFISLAAVLRDITKTTAGGASAATGSIRPSTSDRSVYATTYSPGEWTGDVKRGEIDLATGAITWDSISAADLLQSKVGSQCDGRTIYLQSGNRRVDFTWNTARCKSDGTPDTASASSALTTTSAAITATDLTWIADNLKSTRFAALTPPGKSALEAGDLVNFLRGQYGKEWRDSVEAKHRWFRERTKALGDLVGSQPLHVATPMYNYIDRGYLDEEVDGATVSGFKTRKNASSRAPTLYVGGNDGMLHAFNPTTLEEKWAIVPSLVVPSLVNLANPAYAMQHRFFVDGSPAVGDVFDASASGTHAADKWKTILVGGLRKGGIGYYALNVTDPDDPKPLWEFSCDTVGAKTGGKCDLGLSFGEPIITKRLDGGTSERWVVLVSSGYNSESGRAVLFVLDALTGEVLKRIAAEDGSGEVGAPGDQAGFASMSGWADDGMRKNLVEYVYGGDIRGRVWRFKITAGEEGSHLLARLTDRSSDGLAQSITAAPELAYDDQTGRRMVFVPTGKLLTATDATSAVKDSMWGLADHSSSTPTTRAGGEVTVCTVSVSSSGRTSSCTGTTSNSRGWVMDLPMSGERINVNPIVQLGSLIFASNQPTSTDVCVAKGETFLYYLDISNGGALATSSGAKVGHAVAGVLAVGMQGYSTSGGYKVSISGSDGQQIVESPPTKSASATGKRVSWRELVR